MAEVAEEKRLRRDIGFTGSAFLSFNGVVGAGIFALPAALSTQFGTFSPWLFPLFGLLVLVVALPFSRLAAYHPASGGPVMYTAPFGPIVSFQIGWIYYVARATALAANSNVFVTYAATIWAPLGEGVPRIAAILILCALLVFINIVGVKRAIRALDALTLLKAAPLILIALYGLYAAAGSLPAPGPVPPLSELEAAALLILYAFVGFENSVVPAGETANPGRTIPRALIATILGTMLLYFIVQLAYVAVMPAGSGGDAPLVAFGAALLGPAGAVLLTAAALFSLGGNLLGTMTATPRTTFAMARDGLLPKWFAVVSDRYRTPVNSILFMGLLAAVLAISGSFVWLAVVSTLARMIVYSASIAALPATMRKAEGAAPAGLLTYVSAAAAIAVCGWAAFQSPWGSWRMLLVLVAIGAVLYFVARRTRPRPE
jgi:amino acid transporter